MQWRAGTGITPPNTYYNPGVLGGSGPNTASYTRAQVGAAARPSTPPPGGSRGWGGSNAVPDPRRTAYPDSKSSEDPTTRLPSPVRAFRGRGGGAAPSTMYQGPGTQAPSGAVTRTGLQTLTGHAAGTGFPVSGQASVLPNPAYPVTTKRFFGGTNAVVDPQRQFDSGGDPAGYPGAVSPTVYPREFMTRNVPVTGVGGGGQVPAEWMEKWNILTQRPRAGGTSADDYRPARRWVQTPSERPFDKNGLSYPNRGRHALPNPLASTPLFYPENVRDGVPSHGGWFAAPGMRPVGIQQNTARLIPQPWDQTLVNAGSGDGTARVGQSYRARAWKAG